MSDSNKKPNSLNKAPNFKLKYIVFVFIAVVSLWFGTFLIIIFWDAISTKLHIPVSIEPGTLGDSFGMVNSLFSACAFAMLIWSSIMQKIELHQNTEMLSQQADELKNQRIELERSAKAQEQNLIIIEQQLRSSVLPVLTVQNGAFQSHDFLNDIHIIISVDKFPLTVVDGTAKMKKQNEKEKIELATSKYYISPGESIHLYYHGQSSYKSFPFLGEFEFLDMVKNSYQVKFHIAFDSIAGDFTVFLDDVGYNRSLIPKIPILQ